MLGTQQMYLMFRRPGECVWTPQLYLKKERQRPITSQQHLASPRATLTESKKTFKFWKCFRRIVWALDFLNFVSPIPMLLTSVGSLRGKKQNEFSDGPLVQPPTIRIWNICRTAFCLQELLSLSSAPPPLMSVGLFIAAQLEMKPSITAVVFHQCTRRSYNWRSNNKSCSACGNCQSYSFWPGCFYFYISLQKSAVRVPVMWKWESTFWESVLHAMPPRSEQA